jgi:hypothetical protein
MATVSVKLSIINNKIHIDPDSCKVNPNDQISFYTNDDNVTFEVALHNPDGFFDDIARVYSGEVVDTTPLVIKISDPDDDHNVKYYSVCATNVDPQPLPPDAPPRIIVHV